jgi:cytochrome c oxidase subunit 2
VEAEGVALSPAAEGAKLFVGQGCAACHQQGSSQLAPDLAGIYNSEQVLADGSKVTADEAYLLESIRQPQAKVVRGYAAAMPSYAHLPEEDLAKLLEYLKSL